MVLRPAWRSVAPLLLVLVVACDGAPASTDGGGIFDGDAPDARVLDAGIDDAGRLDGLSPEPDAGGDDGGVPDAALGDAGSDGGAGTIGIVMGSCGELDDTELLSAMPFLFEGSIDFPEGFTEMRDEALLSEGAQEILRDGTAGGSSGLSEAFAFEILHRCEGAALLKTETEIVYDVMGSLTDILVTIDGHKIGVSVTRAVSFPRDDPYPLDTARALLERKLAGINESSDNVSAADAWVKQILHVIAWGPMHAESMAAAWALVDAALRADTILWITVTDGMDDFLY